MAQWGEERVSEEARGIILNIKRYDAHTASTLSMILHIA